MKRRTFLELGAGAAAVAALWPSWLRSAFADATVERGARSGVPLSDAAADALESGKPLLILVIPDGWGGKWLRGRHVEGLDDDRPAGVSCGMGRIPRKSGRFLFWYSRTPRQIWRDDQYPLEAPGRKT